MFFNILSVFLVLCSGWFALTENKPNGIIYPSAIGSHASINLEKDLFCRCFKECISGWHLGSLGVGLSCPPEYNICCPKDNPERISDEKRKKRSGEDDDEPEGGDSDDLFVEEEELTCGKRDSSLMDLTKVAQNPTDVETQYGDFPWQLIILMKNGTEERKIIIGGATLIHPSLALTIAENLENGRLPHGLILRAGEYDLNDVYEKYSHQDRSIESVILHKNYVNHPVRNNIAMLVVSEPFQIGFSVNPICLPPKDMTPDWSICYASGWKKPKYNEPIDDADAMLRKVKMNLISSKVCEEELKKSYLLSSFKLHKSFICARGENGMDTVKGYGGGPLACQRNEAPYNFFLVGLTAWGIPGFPGAYVNIDEMSNWISTTIENLKSTDMIS